jgi:hypothetical protein
MKAKSHFLLLLLYMFIHSGVFCQDDYILYISDATNDLGFTEVLENAGYNVIRIVNDYRGILNQDELDYANNAALIIMSRNCVSAEYGGTETLASQWNSIETPLITFSVFITRNIRWQWFNSENILCEGDHSIRVPASSSKHRVYEWIGTSGTFDIYTGIGPDHILEADIGNGKVLAYNSDESGILIAEWSAGIPFYEGTAQIPAAKRVFFAAGESDCGPSDGQNMSAYNLNTTGKNIFLNTVRYLIPDATFYRFPYGNTPVVDGKIDPIWGEVDVNYVQLYDQINTDAGPPTFDLVTWKAAWNDTAIFIIIKVEDDDFFPSYEAGSPYNWEYDKPEIYLDVNVGELNDGLGPVTANTGHYQYAPEFFEGINPYFNSGITWFGCYLTNAYYIDDPNYVYEYAVSISYLLNKHGNVLDPKTEPTIGFDVNVNDRDEGDAGTRSAVWKNNQTEGASWTNMDDCGEVAFSNEVIGRTSVPFYKFQDGCVPVIDGIKDPIWELAEAHKINRRYQYENPSLDLATWKAAWNDTAIFILVTVEENDFYPSWISGDYDWMSDKVEIYFDVNDYLKDGGGPWQVVGHYQVAPDFHDNIYQDNASTDYYSGYGESVYTTYGYNVNAPNYVYEYAVRIEDLIDNNGKPLDPYNIDMMGFDVCIIDRDKGDNNRKRAVWRNSGAIDESWANMDDCGTVTFRTNPDAEFPKPEIRLKGKDILICLDSGRNSYTWYYENQQLTDETKQFCRITSGFTGNYYVAVDNEYGCKIKSNPIYFSAKAGTLKSSEPYIEIYPVPNTGSFRFEMSGDQSGRIIINIRDFSGKIIRNLVIDKNTEPVSEEINLLNVPKGIYMLDITFNNEAYIRRILIN